MRRTGVKVVSSGLTLQEYAEAVVAWDEYAMGVQVWLKGAKGRPEFHTVDIELWDAILPYILAEGA